MTQPRVTCYRVGIRMNDARMPGAAGRRITGRASTSGCCSEGEVGAGDEIAKLARGPQAMTVAEIDALLYLPGHPRAAAAQRR